jgi:heme exporter protein B
MTAYLSVLRALVWKELAVEVRSRESVLAGAVFGLLALVIFSVAFDLRVENAAAVAPGALWMAVSFAGMLALGRAFNRERDRQTLDGLLLAPVDRSAIYLAKVIAGVLVMVAVEVVAVPASIALFTLRVDLLRLAAGLLLGTLGFAVVGVLFAAMTAHTRAREALLPILLLPVQTPVIIATVKSTGAAIALPGIDVADPGPWLGLLVAFYLLFMGLGVLLFEYAIGED